VLAVSVTGAIGFTLTFAQNRTIDLAVAPPEVSTGAFTTTSVEFTGGKALPAQFVMGNGCLAVWDIRTHVFGSGDHAVRFPVAGIVNCSASQSPESGFMVFASETIFISDLKVGESRAGLYVVQPKQAIKAGVAVPTLIFVRNGVKSVMSIESQSGTDKDAARAEPVLAIFEGQSKADDRATVLQAWRESKACEGYSRCRGCLGETRRLSRVKWLSPRMFRVSKKG
jgi:hypothetical protein